MRCYLDRREFLKTSSTALAVAIAAFHSPTVMQKLLPEPTRSDAESQYCRYLMDHATAGQAIHSIKSYGFSISEGRISDFFYSFCDRQPEMVFWLKSRLKVKDPHFNEDSYIWNMQRRCPAYPNKKWHTDAAKMHFHVMKKFGFKIREDYVERMEVINKECFEGSRYYV